MIPFFCQTLVELVYLIFALLNNSFGDEPATFITRSLSWLKCTFILLNSTWRNNKYTNLCQFCLIAFEEILFQFIYCPQNHGSFFSVPILLVKLTVLAFTDWSRYQSYHLFQLIFPCRQVALPSFHLRVSYRSVPTFVSVSPPIIQHGNYIR